MRPAESFPLPVTELPEADSLRSLGTDELSSALDVIDEVDVEITNVVNRIAARLERLDLGFFSKRNWQGRFNALLGGVEKGEQYRRDKKLGVAGASDEQAIRVALPTAREISSEQQQSIWHMPIDQLAHVTEQSEIQRLSALLQKVGITEAHSLSLRELTDQISRWRAYGRSELNELQDEKKFLRFGGGYGFWGDVPSAVIRLIQKEKLDGVLLDFMAELSYQIMATYGKKLDFPKNHIPMILEAALPIIVERKIQLVTNGGALNPAACHKVFREIATKMGLEEIKSAYATGDDITAQIQELHTSGKLTDLNGEAFSDDIASKIISAHVYSGAEAGARALEQGALVFFGGRVADPSLGMMMAKHKFQWSAETTPDYYHKMGAAAVATHIGECGGQATGGNSGGLENDPLQERVNRAMGRPIIEMDEEGNIYITQAVDQDGAPVLGEATIRTVLHQLVYEVRDFGALYTPDVIADMSDMKIEQVSRNRVKISGIKGRPPTKTAKVSMAYKPGTYSAIGGQVLIPGEVQNAQIYARQFWETIATEVEGRVEENTIKKEISDAIAAHFPAETGNPPVSTEKILTTIWKQDWNPGKLVFRERDEEGLEKLLSSTVGSEAWNSRDLKSRPH